MGLPTVDTCCCGCSLQTGSKIIGYLGAIFSIIGVITFAVFLAVVTSAATDKDKELLIVMKVVMGIAIALSLISAIFSILLIIGATTGRASFLSAWIIFTFIGLGISILMNISTMVSQFGAGKTSEGVSTIISLIVGTALTVYFCIVVSSYRKEIQGGR